MRDAVTCDRPEEMVPFSSLFYLLKTLAERAKIDQVRGRKNQRRRVNVQTHLFEETVREGLYTEFEGAEVGGLVQSLHLFRHQSLMNQFAFCIRRIH